MCSWNIGGAKDKLSNDITLKFLHEYDVIWILEVKQISSTRIPGFIVYYNPSKHGNHREGVMLLIKYEVQNYIKSVKLELESQIWIELSCYPDTYFGGLYSSPEDSP